MKARVKWVEQVAFLGETESNHAVLMDGSPAAGGRTSFDVISILKKSRQAVTDCYVELTAERAETDPKVFTTIHMHFVVTGRDIKPEMVEKAIKLSAEKYCSASIMLGATAKVTHDFEVVQEMGK